MSDIETQDADSSPNSGRPRGASHWRSKTRRPPLQHDLALRQGRISHFAFDALGRDQAIAFLNDDNLTLGGRPLAIATASLDGEEIVTREIERLRKALHSPDTSSTVQDIP